MDKKKIITLVSVAGGAYLLYWFLTNYGPSGPVSAGGQSYWDSWFGSSVVPGVVPTTQVVGLTPASTIPTQSVTTTPAAVTTTVPIVAQTAIPTPIVPTTSSIPAIKSQILSLSTGDTNIDSNGQMNAYQWNYYYNKVMPQNDALFNSAFPGNDAYGLYTLDAFLARLQGAGLSGIRGMGAIVPTISVPSVPSMSFGGGFRNPNSGNWKN